MKPDSIAERGHDDARAPVDIAFIVPVRNDSAALARCLESIHRDAGSTAPIIVADNGSRDDSAAVAQRLGARVLTLPHLKVGELRNRGAAAAASDLLAFVDADHEIGEGWLRAAHETLRDPGIGAVGAPYRSPATATWVQRVYDAFRDHRAGIHAVDWLGAGNLIVRSAAFRTVGGFDRSLEACEDVDLCQRLKRSGFAIVSDARMVSIHYGDPRTIGALFRGELWRGRDNLRVSLRGPLTVGGLPSILTPVVDLISVVVVLAGTAIGAFPTAAAAAAIFLLLSAMRAARLFRRLQHRTPGDAAQVLLVAVVYDFARALALVARTPHRRAAGTGDAVPAR